MNRSTVTPGKGEPRAGSSNATRVAIEPDKVEEGLVKLVLVVVELLRRLLEKQAMRRIDGGHLSPEQIERLATTLMKLEAHVKELQAHFGIEDLDMDLGPLGKVLD
jgi:Gas vesicle protein K